MYQIYIRKNRGKENDNKTESLSEKSCNDHGSHISNRQDSMTPELTRAIEEALAARELIKVSVLKNCIDDPHMLADMIAERTHSQVVQVIGKKIVLYKEGKDDKKRIELPR